jgi:oligopeptide transport system ATP-binding protein
VNAVRGVSFDLKAGETLGIVGESGSGKSVTCMSILKLLASTGQISDGEVLYHDEDLVQMSMKEIRKIRGDKISMIFQDPMTSLNPLIPTGKQITEMLKIHYPKMTKQQLKNRVLELFDQVKIPEPEKRYKQYPHEFSGGMRQRVMIAMALACNPEILIADEPTTALDVTIQDQILKLLRTLQAELNMSILFITHDLGVVAELCSRVIVMYGGLIMEEALIDDLFENPAHPYTMGLLKSIPNLQQDKNIQLTPIPGSPPDMTGELKGCPFAPRCAYARKICIEQRPPVVELTETHKSMCWLLSSEAPLIDNPFADTWCTLLYGGERNGK